MGPLELVDLIDSSKRPIDGLVAVNSPHSAESDFERAALVEASAFHVVDYIFFRRFKDDQGRHVRSSQIAAYVIDNSRGQRSEDDLAVSHRQLWLHGTAPIVYVAWPTRIDVLACARRPDFWHVTSSGATIRYSAAASVESTPASNDISGTSTALLDTAAAVARSLRARVSAFRLAEGTFWDDPDNQKLAKADAAAHASLIQAIVETDELLMGSSNPIRRRLLVLMILVKYLEDRGVFPAGLFGRFHAGARSFLDILQKGSVKSVRRLLRYLERKFNGDVFSLGSSVNELTRTELDHFAKFVDTRHLGGQHHFWELYSFEHVPVEVISRVYQRFVRGHGAVYTPPFLAALLLDQVVPYGELRGDERILDPSCGSGVFLVGAFKRLVVRWRSLNGWSMPSVAELKAILARSIYGVEFEQPAVDLTAFSLALAICDALEPPVIWNSLKFDKLQGRNLRCGDFFDPATFGAVNEHDWPINFDVIIGNPPFESELTHAGGVVERSLSEKRTPLPDSQAAYLFLEQATKSLALGGSLCLIQPHGLLYNRQTLAFRRHLMSLSRLHAVLDFVSLRGLYEGADPKTIAWHAVYEPPNGRAVAHVTFRRTYSASEGMGLEVDHYDWHQVPYVEASGNPFVWRVNLLGGGRLHELAERFRRMTPLAEFIAKKGGLWDYGEGFIAGKSGKRSPAPHLTGKPLLPTRSFTQTGIDREMLRRERPVVRETLFKSSYDERRFSAPLILIKAHESLPTEFWNDGPIAYRDKIIGIHAPKSEQRQLRELFDLLSHNKEIYRFACAMNGSQHLTGKATVPLKQDLDLLPIPENSNSFELTFWESILMKDVLTSVVEYVRLGQDSPLLARSPTEGQVGSYATLFVKMLGSLYDRLNACDAVHLNGLIAQPFFFGKQPEVSWLASSSEESLHTLIYDQSRETLRTARVVRYYEANVILIVKPDRLRYWIDSTALRDADETLVDLRRQGW